MLLPTRIGTSGISIRIALPDVTEAPFDAILQIVADVSNQWVGMAWAGQMTYNPLVVGWPNGNSMVVSSRYATGYSLPSPYTDAYYIPLKGTGVNSTSWTLTLLCKNFSTYQDVNLNNATIDPTETSHQLAYSQSDEAVTTPSSNTSTFRVHDSTGTWYHNLAAARNSLFDTWVADNMIGTTTSSSTVVASTTSSVSSSSSSTVLTSTVSTSVCSAAPSAFPTSCSGVAAQRYPGQLASGWEAVKIAGSLTAPRGITIDTSGNLLVVQNGLGITVHTLGSNGCIASTKTLISQTNLNHGIYLTPDGKTLYASSATTVYKWTYDPVAVSVGTSSIVVMGMNTAGHITRTLLIPQNQPNLLVVSHGSDANLDYPAGTLSTERAVIKVFDMNSVPSGGYNFVTGGYQAGYGLRNEVGIVFDGNNLLWGVENSSDDIQRTVNGQTTDVHADNPADELNYIGNVSVANTQWYGYPTCFTIWNPSGVTDKTFSVGDQFVLTPNSTFNDTTCISNSAPPRLGFQAHSAPLDSKFDATYSNLYVSFHGSWDRQPPTGFKLVAVPFSKGSDGSYNPTAALNSGSGGYKDIWWNTDVTQCSAITCFRPVGIAINGAGRMFVTSDASAEGELFMLASSSSPNACTTTTTTSISSSTSLSTTSQISTSPTRTTTSPVSTTSPSGPTQTRYGQCGGTGWTGPTVCASPWVCTYSNAYYSQHSETNPRTCTNFVSQQYRSCRMGEAIMHEPAVTIPIVHGQESTYSIHPAPIMASEETQEWLPERTESGNNPEPAYAEHEVEKPLAMPSDSSIDESEELNRVQTSRSVRERRFEPINSGDRAELERIASTFSGVSFTRTLTNVGGELERRDTLAGVNVGDPVLDPKSPEFDVYKWSRMMMKLVDEKSVIQRRAGIVFKSLKVCGSGSAINLQRNVGSLLLAPLRLGEFFGRGPEKTILNDFDGVLKSGEMLVVLGRPGSGCSTFLKSLMGELHGLDMKPQSVVHYNGITQKQMLKQFRGEIVYNQEVDKHFPHLTVGQTLEFAARVRTPHQRPIENVSREHWAKHMAQVVMTVFGLSHTYNTKVGNDFVRGVSGGERKRVSIAEMALAGSPIASWDNSTRGLDAATALEFTKSLRMSANLSGACHLVAIYQASQAIYDEFDKAVVLYEGRQIYFGPCDEAKQYFIDMGWECPARQTTGDFLTSITNPSERKVRQGFEKKVPRTPDEFEKYWKESTTYKDLIQEIEDHEKEFPMGGKTLETFQASRKGMQANHLRPESPYTINIPMQIKYCT
ncbi:hypothetical protein B7494_g3247, partial [Chlorociboria aeruginascens]